MKTNTYMVLRVIYEWCIGVCHEYDLKMKTIRTSCILCVHIQRDTSPFMMMSTDVYTMMMMVIMPSMTLKGLLTSGRTISSTMIGQEGYEPSGDPHSHVWVV